MDIRPGLAVLGRAEGGDQSSFEFQSFKFNAYPSYSTVSFMLVILDLPLCIMLRRESA